MIGRVNTGGGGTGGTLTVTAPANVTVAVSKDGKTKTKNSGTSGVVVFKGLASGTWTVTITGDGKTAQKNVVITTDYSTAISFNTIPEFTYTGDYEIVNDSDEPITVSQGNWKIRFLTSGTLTFTNLNGAEGGIDVFLVGGGAKGLNGTGPSNEYYGSGGGGGYTSTKRGISVQANTSYTITVGAESGNTSAFNTTAKGASGINGGSGGAGGFWNGYGGVIYGGQDGANGNKHSGNESLSGGTGQGTTTREFGESSGRLYSTGGAANRFANATENTGNGGDGGKAGVSNPGYAGGSGIAIIRNTRGAA
jgi:hypothetical protein